MKFATSCLVVLVSMTATLSNARDLSAQPVKLSKPVAIAQDIHHLYMDALKESMSPSARKSIICDQLPQRFNDYMRAAKTKPNADDQGYAIISNVKQNLKETQQYYKISCK